MEDDFDSSSENDGLWIDDDERMDINLNANTHVRRTLPSPADPVPKDYWFGQKYFECIVAQGLLRQTTLLEQAAGIDSKLAAVLRNYPFQQCWQQLRTQGITTTQNRDGSGPDHRLDLLTLVGTVIRQGSARHRRAMVETIRNLTFTNAGSTGRERAEPQGRLPEISKYTTILKEYGDDIGEEPEYTSQRTSLEPPVFKERVTLQGVTEEGTGKTRKEAKHRASQKACRRLRLPED